MSREARRGRGLSTGAARCGAADAGRSGRRADGHSAPRGTGRRLAAALACQAVARLRPRAPPLRSAPSHGPVRARAEAAARFSRSLGSGAAAVAAWCRLPGERRRWRLGASRSDHLPPPSCHRLVSAPRVLATLPGFSAPIPAAAEQAFRGTPAAARFRTGAETQLRTSLRVRRWRCLVGAAPLFPVLLARA